MARMAAAPKAGRAGQRPAAARGFFILAEIAHTCWASSLICEELACCHALYTQAAASCQGSPSAAAAFCPLPPKSLLQNQEFFAEEANDERYETESEPEDRFDADFNESVSWGRQPGYAGVHVLRAAWCIMCAGQKPGML